MLNVNKIWDYQIRINFSEPTARLVRHDLKCAELAPLADVLKRHNATLRCQFDAFAAYVAEAEKYGIEHYGLYEWTRATLRDPMKEAKYLKSFTVYVGGKEVYPKGEADTLEADLKPMVESKTIEKILRYDTNPANNPQAPQRLDE